MPFPDTESNFHDAIKTVSQCDVPQNVKIIKVIQIIFEETSTVNLALGQNSTFLCSFHKRQRVLEPPNWWEWNECIYLSNSSMLFVQGSPDIIR